MLKKQDIKKHDRSNMFSLLENFSEQIVNSFDIVKNIQGNNNVSRYLNCNNIICCGMGGSSIGALFIKEIISKNLDIPLIVNNNYNLPNWSSKKSLVILSSYSGNTVETISCYHDCIQKNINPIVITSGGYLLKESIENNLTHFVIPSGILPRTAFGYMSSVLLLLFRKIGLFKTVDYKDELKNTANDLKLVKFNFTQLNDENPALKLATQIKDNNIIIFCSPSTKSIGYRFKCQLAENSKILSYYNYLPELNHNEVEGFTNLINKNYCLIWINDKNDSLEIIDSINKTSTILENIQNQYFLNKSGNSYLERQYKLINFLDWVSFYLAILYKTNPSPINNINKIKK